MKKSILILNMLASYSCFADSPFELNFENNCNFPITFTVNGEQANSSYLVEPTQYVKVKELSSMQSLLKPNGSYTYKVIAPNASIDMNFQSGRGGKSILFKNLNNMSNNLYLESSIFRWHKYPNLKGLIGTPTFNISTCNNAKLDIEQSKILAKIKRIVIFGDSLSDDGNLSRADQGVLPKSTPYYNGQFSNGNPWSAQLKQLVKYNDISVSNYAVGGALAVYHRQKDKLPFSLAGEYKAYSLNSHLFKETSEQRLAIILIGANDYFSSPNNMTEIEVEKKVDDVIENGINNLINKLLKNGIKNFILVNLPSLDSTPLCSQENDCPILTLMTQKHNSKLKQLSHKLIEQYKSGDFMFKLIDLGGFYNQAINDTKLFNNTYGTHIENTTAPCWSGGYTLNKSQETNSIGYFNANLYGNQTDLPQSPDLKEAYRTANYSSQCTDPNKYLFWDHVHPTYQIHKAFLTYFLKNISVSLLKAPH